MIFEPKLFYQRYLKDYHHFKAIYLKKILDDLPKYEKEFFENELNKEDRDSFRRTLKSDLRQTYFHCIEAFFELFFALNPQGKKYYDDELVLKRLANSKWQANYSKIQKIAKDAHTLDFLDDKVKFLNHEITIGHYLFYMGVFPNGKFPPEIFNNISESIDAIKYGMRILANDFTNRDEYTAYKHGLRIIPAASALMMADAETREIKLEWDLSESMSFFVKTNNPQEIKVVTKLFDTERDYQMTHFSSNLIHHLVYLRRIAMRMDNTLEKGDKIGITFFGKEPIKECSKINVRIQDLVYSSVPVDTKS